MRIAVSGSHRCGKSTLIADIQKELRAYRVVDEPYRLLEEDGHEFAHPPSAEDFVEQLRFSIDLLEEPTPNLLLDRCPVDFLAYLAIHPDSSSCDTDEWLGQIREALQTLDFIVFTAIEEPDRIRVSRTDEFFMRSAADEKLRELLLDDPFRFEVEVLIAEGSRSQRVEHVLQRVRRG